MDAGRGSGEIAFGSRPPPDRGGDSSVLERLLGSVTCSVASCGWYAFPPGWSIPERALDWHVAYLCVGGALEVVRGADDRAVIRHGELLLAAPGERHRLGNPGPDPLHLLTAHFSARIHDVLDMPSVYELPARLRPRDAQWSAIESVVRVMIGELDRREPGWALAANAACARFVALLWRATIDEAGGRAHPAPSRAGDIVRLAPVFRLIHERYAERPTLSQLADVIHLEPDYFATVFKRVTGVPPLRYVASYRLERVRTLLAATDEPIGEIAARTGFADSFYLSRAFRRAYGMTPSAYRKSRDRPDLP